MGWGLEEFELLAWGIGLYGLAGIENLHVGKLFIGDAEHAYMATFWQDGPYTPHVHLGVLHTGAVAQIDGELKHGEAILHDLLTECGSRLALALGLGRKVEKHHYPHDAVFAEPFTCHDYQSG